MTLCCLTTRVRCHVGEQRAALPLVSRRLYAFIMAAAVAAAAAAGTVLQSAGGGGNGGCPAFAAQFDATAPAALVIRLCGLIPLPVALPGTALRYDLQLRLQIPQDYIR